MKLLAFVLAMWAEFGSWPFPRVMPAPPLPPVIRHTSTPRNVAHRPPLASVRGVASWYAWRPEQAAACAPLRAALGAGWRGRIVNVVFGAIVRTVTLTDYCPQTERVIDLDSRTFDDFAPLTVGLVEVTVTW